MRPLSGLSALFFFAAASAAEFPDTAATISYTHVIEDSIQRYGAAIDLTGNQKDGRVLFGYNLLWESSEEFIKTQAQGRLGPVDLEKMSGLNASFKGPQTAEAKRGEAGYDRIYLERDGERVYVIRDISSPSEVPGRPERALRYRLEGRFLKGDWDSFEAGGAIEVTFDDPDGAELKAQLDFADRILEDMRASFEAGLRKAHPTLKHVKVHSPKKNHYEVFDRPMIRARFGNALKYFDPGLAIKATFRVTNVLDSI